MAESGRTVRVSGLPSHIEDDRLKDKLFIHFLRARNGGGEINSVTIVKATPVSALITFDDSRVAQRVIQHRQHTLEVDEKKYKILVTEHQERMDPDKVILNLSATVDHSQLPGGAMAMTHLHKSHPDIEISYGVTEELCTLNGAYSKVQAALAQLLGLPKGPKSAGHKESSQPATSGSKSVQAALEPHIPECRSRKHNKQWEQREKVHLGRHCDDYNSGSHRDTTPGAYVLEDTTEGAARQLPVHPPASEDDFSLIVDADMFQYTQKHCREEYEHILNLQGDTTDQQFRSEEDERRAEGARKYKLAARFKDSGLAALGSRPTDFSLRGFSSPLRQTGPGPIPGHDVLSETAGTSYESVSRALAQNTGGDILFKSGYALPSNASLQNKTSLQGHLIDTRLKSLPSTISTTQSSASGSALPPPAGSGSTLKRASSFSGTPLQKAQVVSQKSQDDSARSTVKARGRSASFGNQAGKDKREVCHAEVTLSGVMWEHIKEAYSSRVDDLTSDVQMKERCSEGSLDVTLTLRGATSSRVNPCQLGLQKLADSVGVDFSVHELRLSELGVTDAEDETLQACCAEVRGRFKKVTMQFSKKSLYLRGPQVLCSQVGASLREVFSGDLVQVPEQQDLCGPSTSKWSPSTFLPENEDQSSLHCWSNPQVMLGGQTSKAHRMDSGQERRRSQRSDFRETELVNGSINQLLARKNPVFKERVKVVEPEEMEGLVSHSKTGMGTVRHVNDVMLTTTNSDKDTALPKKEIPIDSGHKESTQQRHAGMQDTREESSLGAAVLGSICVCCEIEAVTIKTKCGATMCSTCRDTLHIPCRVCQEAEATTRGIKGQMSYSKLNITVPGHKKDSAIKITYCIPDGIQGENHPSPGEAFQGGVFEAFLPDSERTRTLLPRLEEAFRQGLIFTVIGVDTGARASWDGIPHKTTLHGGKSG
uniref:E3 ubiquitin-protein ligase n=1 Tax=Gasterosteus aculeatus aculeatus TaxID=481459 RepID=A0AAQ4R719_GASAC